MRQPGRVFEAVVLPTGDLRPGSRRFAGRRGEMVSLREMTPEEIRSERQLRYWYAAVVPVFVDQWERERGRRYSKEEAHAALMVAFGGGPVQTPFGVTYPSSGWKTRAEFARITDEARAYALEQWRCPIPTPDEWREAA